MKKCYALILVMLLLACGCSETDNPSDVTDSSTVSAENLAASIALTYHTAAWSEPADVSDPMFVWETIGWYTVYDSRLTGTDSTEITAEKADEICQILAPDSSDIPIPEDFVYGSVSENGYIFDGTKEYFDSYMGVVAELNVKADDALNYTVDIADHYDAETVYSEYQIVFSGTAENFKFDSLSTVSVESVPGVSATESETLNFTYDDLCKCNNVETLLGYGKTIRITSEYEDADFYTYIEHIPDSSDFMIWYGDGSGGYYKNYYFFTDEGRIHVIPLYDNGAWLTEYVSNANFDSFAKMEYVSEEGDNITFRYKYDTSSRVITVDRGSLAIRTSQLFDENGKNMGTLRYEYGNFDVTSPITDDREGETRTVTLKMQQTANDTEEWTVETYLLPVSWELDPSGYCPWGEAFLDENFSEEYVFPAGNDDYTIYITDSKG